MASERLPNIGGMGVRGTLAVMARFARQGKSAPSIRELAMSHTNHLHRKDWLTGVRSLHSFVRDQVRDVDTGIGLATVQTPEQTLEIGAGDCNAKATLLAALLLSIHHPARFVAIGVKASPFSHVYVETRIVPRWIALETTVPAGGEWSSSEMKVRLEFPIK